MSTECRGRESAVFREMRIARHGVHPEISPAIAMYVTYICPRCERSHRSEPISRIEGLNCSACGWSRPFSETVDRQSETPRECLRCGNEDLWRQKNFPQWLGLLFVAAGAISSSIAWAYHRPVWALGILMGFALLDMMFYLTMPDVLVCYRCRTKHHRADVSRHGAFNHELAERYRQERIRLQQSAEPPAMSEGSAASTNP